MREFSDENRERWVASAREEQTPRHHGRWYLIFHPAAAEDRALAMPEVRWQTRETAARTLDTMSEFELRRRLNVVRSRTAAAPPGTEPATGSLDR
jgi:hypothetical protein